MRLDTWLTADKFAPLLGLCTAGGTVDREKVLRTQVPSSHNSSMLSSGKDDCTILTNKQNERSYLDAYAMRLVWMANAGA